MTHKPPDHPVGVGKILLALWVFANIVTPVNAQQQQLQQQHSLRTPELPQSLSHGKSTWVEPPPSQAHLSEDEDSGLQDDTEQNTGIKKTRAASGIKDTRAIIPFAPAERRLADAVRESARASTGPKPTGGISSRQDARSLQDWKVEDIVLLATVDGGIHAADRETGKKLWTWPGDKPIIETEYHANNKSTDDTSGDGDPLVNNFIWIVEPSEDGALYAYTPGMPFGMGPTGLSVKNIVNDIAGFEAENPRVVYNGEKKTTLYTIDIATGNVLRNVSAAGSLVNSRREICRQKDQDDILDDDKCRPIGALTMIRTEYIVGIHSVDGNPLCTIKYSEWGANKRDKDLGVQYSRAKNNRYIHGRSNGEIYAFEHKYSDDPSGDVDPKPAYHQKYSSAVVRVFDIARPIRSTDYDTHLILLPQPVDPVLSQGKNNDKNVLVDETHTGSLYALSQANYPLVAYEKGSAQCVGKDMSEMSPELTLQEYLVGVHPLDLSSPSHQEVPSIGGIPRPEALDAPNNDTPGDSEDTPALLPGPSESSRKIGLNYTQIFLAVLVICLTGVGAGRFLPNPSFMRQSKSLPVVAQVPEPEMPLANISTPPAETEPIQAPPEIPKSVKFQEDVDKENQPPTGAEITREVTPVDGEEGAAKSGKKAHRGKRGGKKAAEKRALKATLEQDQIDGIVEGVKQMNQNMSLTPDVVYKSKSEEEDAPAGLLNLEIRTDQVLGHGSGGTLVFEGRFEGRDVAVKRMLGQYSELASQEVSLLEQSEEHPNVIRYFCRRQDEHFLYIALELCQASLWEIYRDGRRDEVPEKYNPILEEINTQPQRVLRQLAEGLKHLHTFRIVHRDIKPQNMLIAYPKKHMVSTFPRIVISDFGLCKTLPEGASTLIGATVSAGTIGWKAPELITQPKDSNGMSASSTGKDSTNGDFAGAFGIKRSTDIFSLGCVFFYVLTGGQHPYDDEEGWMGIRERNIKSDKCNLEAISIHGPDTVDLIRWMLEPKPEDRPTASEVLAHPFFWNAEDRLEFLSLTSDRFDMEARDGTSAALARLESHAEDIIGAGPATLSLTSASASSRYNTSSANHHRSSSNSDSTSNGLNLPIPGEPNFLAALDKKFIDTLGKQRKYQGHKVVDLLRALRNKHHHWDDMPEDVKLRVGAVPEGYLRYWEQRFPKLTVRMWRVVKELGMGNERRYWRWFGGRVE